MGSDDVTAATDPPAARAGWLRRDHPTLTPLLGFWAGMATVLVLPALYVMLLRTLMEHESAERWFWGVLVLPAIPIALIATGRSRRAGLYMLFGMAVTVAVVLGVGGAVLWVLSS